MIKLRPLWLFFILLALLVVLVLETRHKTQEVHSSSKLPKFEKKFILFVPSPFELTMVSKDKEIWPRRFSSKQPPQVSDTPLIYSTYLRSQRAQRAEVDFFRTVAMTASLGEWSTFKNVLGFKLNLEADAITPSKLLNWVKKENCSLYGQELSFRLLQWEPKMLSEVHELFKKCDPQSFHALWFEVLLGLEKNNKDHWETLKEKVQNRRLLLANDSFEFFIYTQLFESLDIKIAHGA